MLMPGPHVPLQPARQQGARADRTDGELGEVYFVTSSRMNLGKYQPDGVICDLAPHDISILLYLLDQPRHRRSAASARSIFREHIPEVAFITLTFESGVTANVQISWLAPAQGARDGDRRQPADGPVRRHGRRRVGAASSTAAWSSRRPTNFGEFQLSYRSGDIVVPRVEAAEPLEPRAAGLRARDPHRRRAALARAARPRDRRRDRGRRDVAAPQRRAHRPAPALARAAA